MTDDGRALSKNQRRRLKKRQEKLQKLQQGGKDAETGSASTLASASASASASGSGSGPASPSAPEVEVEYVSMDVKTQLDLPEDDPAYEEFMRIFGKFSSAEELCAPHVDGEEEEKRGAQDEKTREGAARDKDKDKDDMDENEGKAVSKKQRKKMKRLSVAELKQLVSCPDVVEAHDVTAADPRFLVFLKAYRNTVPVPQHWCHKRKYLQGKRGIEKQPFLLPDFIAQTGIAEVRGVVGEDDDKKKSKQRMRERMQPKMGRIDIDYQVLHDAFFKYQTKPKLTILGDLYYEGKEFEVKLKAKVPGQLSDELKHALGMVDGVPPPWLLNMQRYGPPPAYPNLKIPGLNAPIPEGASFGYHPGGWGKPPVDENGQPLYGDVFGKPKDDDQMEVIDRKRWGELVEDAETEEEESDEEEEEQNPSAQATSASDLDATGMETPLADGIASVSSLASGLTTPGGVIDMRKGIRGNETPEAPPALYTVLEEQQTSVGVSLYGSGHGYVVPDASAAPTKPENGMRSETTRRRRRFEDAEPVDGDASTVSTATTTASTVDDTDSARKVKKAKTEKSKKLKDFKF